MNSARLLPLDIYRHHAPCIVDGDHGSDIAILHPMDWRPPRDHDPIVDVDLLLLDDRALCAKMPFLFTGRLHLLIQDTGLGPRTGDDHPAVRRRESILLIVLDESIHGLLPTLGDLQKTPLGIGVEGRL